MNWLAKNRKYITLFISILLPLLISAIYFMLQRDASGNILFKATWGERLIQLSLVLFVSFLISWLNYKIDNVYTINCTPDNFCKDYFCEYLHQIFYQNDSNSILFTDDAIADFTINQINSSTVVAPLVINKAPHNISSSRIYEQFTKACEFASSKARKNLKMTYPQNPYLHLKEDPDILTKIKNASKNKISKKKYIYITPSSVNQFCKEIIDDYRECKKNQLPNQNVKEHLKKHWIYRYNFEHRKFKDLRWIKREENNEFFIADDNIALFYNREEEKMDIELRKSKINNLIHETSSQSTKDFFKELMEEIIKQLKGSANKKDIREIKYCLRLTNLFENLFVK